MNRLPAGTQPRTRFDEQDETVELLCPSCDDWWPITPDFWERRGTSEGCCLLDVVCKACRRDSRYAYRERPAS